MKNILIAGGSRGIGLAAARLLASQSRLHLRARTPPPDASLQECWQKADLVNEPVGDIPEHIDGLIYCPGTINLKPFQRLTENDFLNDFQVNVLGAVKLIQATLPALKKSDSAAIVLFSSVAATTGMPFHASIATAKAALEGLAKSLAAELAPNIRVNVVAPSLTDTPLAAGLLKSQTAKDKLASRHPAQRIGQPDDIARIVVELIQNPWITGQVIGINGGLGSLMTD
ncbi:MAG: SDR family NAD(P)-dependent oxidoreductase [Endozoicomonas sp.]